MLKQITLPTEIIEMKYLYKSSFREHNENKKKQSNNNSEFLII